MAKVWLNLFKDNKSLVYTRENANNTLQRASHLWMWIYNNGNQKLVSAQKVV